MAKVFPAHAGMILALHLFVFTYRGISRACGDDPTLDIGCTL